MDLAILKILTGFWFIIWIFLIFLGEVFTYWFNIAKDLFFLYIIYKTWKLFDNIVKYITEKK